MERDSDKNRDETWLKDLPIRSEPIGFKAEEMNPCRKCGKPNPPTRLNCFYCSADLEVAAGAHLAQLNLRKLEAWEKGSNIVYVPNGLNEQRLDVSAITRLLSIETDFLSHVLETKSAVPIARLESPMEAAAAVEILSQSGLECRIVGDDVLQSDKLPVRLRGLDFRRETLVLTTFNTNEDREIRADEISLIVTGVIFESKTEIVEKRKKKDREVLLETQTFSDGVLIDIYTESESIGYRIPAQGFDFSCLGANKGLLAVDNMRQLIVELRNFASSAKFIGDYAASRELLGVVWEVERRKDSHGLQRTGFGRTDYTNVESSSNLRQFTKYSRLQRHLL